MAKTAESQTLTPEYIADLIIKRRWFILVPLCITLLIGIYLALTLPKIYEAKTLILVEPQRVPSNYVQSVVTLDISARISTISEQIMSRTNLEKIIDEFNLYSSPENEDMFSEDKVESLRKRIVINLTRERGGADAFSISFRGQDPTKVKNVANALATYFIEENLKVRETQAIATSDFLKGELEAKRNNLEAVEQALEQFKKKYMGELPEQLNTNLRMLDRLQEQVSDRQQALRESKIRLAEVESRLTQIQPVQINPEGRVIQSVSGDVLELNRLKAELEQLLGRYTERHPDVQRVKKMIADQERRVENSTLPQSAAANNASRTETRTIVNPIALQQSSEIKREIALLDGEINELQKEIRLYRERVENTPKREQELMSLQRDYSNIQASYSSLLNRKLEAEIAVNMERKQKGEKFRILDSAKTPEKPIKPDMPKLFVFIVAAGLGIGGGIVFVLEYLNNSFRNPEEIEGEFDLPVLTTVPAILLPKEKLMRKINWAFSFAMMAVSLSLFGGFALLSFKGVDQTMELVRKVVNI